MFYFIIDPSVLQATRGLLVSRVGSACEFAIHLNTVPDSTGLFRAL